MRAVTVDRAPCSVLRAPCSVTVFRGRDRDRDRDRLSLPSASRNSLRSLLVGLERRPARGLEGRKSNFLCQVL